MLILYTDCGVVWNSRKLPIGGQSSKHTQSTVRLIVIHGLGPIRLLPTPIYILKWGISQHIYNPRANFIALCANLLDISFLGAHSESQIRKYYMHSQQCLFVKIFVQIDASKRSNVIPSPLFFFLSFTRTVCKFQHLRLHFQFLSILPFFFIYRDFL